MFNIGDDVEVKDRGPGSVCDVDFERKLYEIDPAIGGEPWTDVPETDLTAHETPQEPRESDETVISEPPTVFEDLGRQYAQATEDRREIFPILPGRFHGNLAVRVRPVDPAKRKKKVRRMMKRGGITDESEVQYAATLIAEATESILVRIKDGEDYVDAHTVSAELGDEPVRFDQRLGKVIPSLGELLNGSESPATIVRLLFKNVDALEGFYLELDQWLKEATPDDEDDEESAERPT
jgi:hypothetical protein